MQNTVHWFRTKGLRLHDNPALVKSTQTADSLRCIFFLDPFFAKTETKGVNKWKFLLQCLVDLDQSLRKFNSRLFVIRGQPADVLPKLFKEWKISFLSFEEDPEPFGKARDQNIVRLCTQLGIVVVTQPSHTLYSAQQILNRNGGNCPLTYRHFLENIEAMSPVSFPLPSPTYLPHTPIEPQFKVKFGVPTMAELGFVVESDKEINDLWRGGESEGLRRLEKYLELKLSAESNGAPTKLTSEALIGVESGISPYLRFGCVSPRLFFHRFKDQYKSRRKSDPPLTLYAQILWREFFYLIATQNPNFDKMDGNCLCLQIPWNTNPKALFKWTHGQTGFPFIDAIMTQLRSEGWIHQQARCAVASFLTRGHLWISWEEGMKVFDELLLDTDLVTNVGTWLWYSGSSFFQPFFHTLCPVRFGRKADPTGEYIRKYIPALRSFPIEFIHEPWTASNQVQIEANCLIGTDYPVPMVSHVTASKINNSERMRQVLSSLSNYKSQEGKVTGHSK